MTTAVKITPAQMRALKELAESNEREHFADEYKPIQKLLALGLVNRMVGKYGQSSYAITDSGREIIKEAEGE